MKRKSILMDKTHGIVKKIFLLTLNFPQIYQFSVGEQLRRAILSIPLNITEGNARNSKKEKKQFFNKYCLLIFKRGKIFTFLFKRN